MKTHLLALSIGVAALALTGAAAKGQTAPCGARELIVERLGSRFGESRQAVGVAANQSLVEVYANGETGSWTITVTLHDGTMCLVASGTSYEALAQVAPAAMGEQL
ncbi:MAG: hypothetical protein AAF618_03460 [Pseudomonadota bacterium]